MADPTLKQAEEAFRLKAERATRERLKRPFLGAGAVTDLPGFGKLTEEEILDIRKKGKGLRDLREKQAEEEAEQKRVAAMDFTFDPKIGFTLRGEDRKQDWRAQPDISEDITKIQEEALHLGPEPLEPYKVKGVREIPAPGISPFQLLSAESEVAGAILDMTPDVITNAVPIVNAMKWGQDFFNYGKPSEETKDIVRGLSPFKEGELGIEESVKRLATIHDEKSIHEQLIWGLMSPSSAIGAGPAKGAATFVKAGFKATDNPSIFKQIIESVPAIVGRNSKQADQFKAASKELVEKVMNPEIKIKGLPEGSLFEGDLRLWIDMPGDAAIDLSKGFDPRFSKIANELGSVFKTQDIEDGYKRLENLGLVKRSKTGIVTKAIHSGSPEAIEILQNYGRKIGMEGASDGNFFIKSLRPMDDIVLEVVAAENPIIGQLAAKTGINPSLLAKTDVQKAVIAYARQNSSINELVEVAIQAGLDSRMLTRGIKIPLIGTARFGAGRSPVKITADGFVEGTDFLWQDIFSMPLDPLDPQYMSKTALSIRELFDSEIISREAMEYIRDYRKIIDEMEKLRVQEGLNPLSKDRDGWLYIPRLAKSKGDIDFVGESKSRFKRDQDQGVEKLATEKLILDEVRYDVDPRATLKIHLKAAYHEILDEQLSGFIASSDTIRSLKLDDAVKATNPKVWKRHDDATKAVLREKAKLKRLTKELQAELEKIPEGTRATTPPPGISRRLWAIEQGAAPFQTAARKKIKAQLDETRAAYKKARGEFLNASKLRTKVLDSYKADKASISGTIFGDVGPEEIPIEIWRKRMYRKEDVEALRKAVGNLSGDASGMFMKNFAKVTDAQRYLMANADFGAPFIQGLPMLSRNPFKWSKATLTSFAAFADPAVQGRFVRQNLGGFQEMAQYGVPVGDVEFFAAMEQGRGLPIGKIISFLPTDEGSKFLGMTMSDAALGTARKMAKGRAGARETQQQTLGRFQATYGMFLARARLELWQSMKGAWTQNGREGNTLAELGAYIRNMTGGLDSKALGVGARQREFESSWIAFSPRLLRSTIALVADAFRFIPAEGMKLAGKGSGGTVRQKESARSLAQLLGGVHLLYATSAVGLGYAKGHSKERIANDLMVGMNPLSGGKYLSVEVDGQYFGVGGQVRALTQVLTGITSALAPGHDPIQNLIALNSRDNPIIRFLANRGAVSQEWAKTVAEGTLDVNALTFDEVEGPKDIAPHLFENSLPFIAQGMMEGDTVPGWLVGATGFRSNPSTPADIEKSLTKDAYYASSDEELAEFGMEKNMFPWQDSFPISRNWKRDMPSDLREKFAEENPEIGEARQANIKEQAKKGNEYGEYRVAKNELIENRNKHILSEEQKLGVGKELRNLISRQYENYVNESEKIDEGFKDLLKNLDDLEDTDEPYNAALVEYWKIMTDSDEDRLKGNRILLEDPVTLEFNFDEYDSRKESLKENPITKPFYGRLVADVEDNPNSSPIVRELQQNRKLLRPYWDIAEQVAETMDFSDKYEFYIKQSQDNKTRFKNGAVLGADWTLEDSIDLSLVLGQIEEDKITFREENLEVEAVLYKWGYIDSPVHIDLLYDIIPQIEADQNGWVKDRGVINKWFPDLAVDLAVAP